MSTTEHAPPLTIDPHVTISEPYQDTRHGRPWTLTVTRGPVVDYLRYREQDEADFGRGLLLAALIEGGRVELARAIRDERVGGFAR